MTLAYPHLIPFIENATCRDLREELSFKFNTQAVEANRKILEEARDLRHQIAEEFGVPAGPITGSRTGWPRIRNGWRRSMKTSCHRSPSKARSI